MDDQNPSGLRRQAQGPDFARLEQDEELYAQLQHSNFNELLLKPLRDDLYVYGWRCLRAWMCDGSITARCAKLDVALSTFPSEVEAMRRRGDLRDELAVDTLVQAMERFVRVALRQGEWNPHRGSTMRTYFVNGCLHQFRETFKKWSVRYRKHLFEVSASVLHLEERGEVGFDEVVMQREALGTILRHANKEAAAICALILHGGATHKEIGAELGMTSRAVEGQMRRLRTTALRLKRAGAIDVPYGPAVLRPTGGER
ncbi:hypothetical protein ACFW81_07480 [Streptomyces angustmyceticus]|uniref:hypothetical protein n=1 Tax=Streptomyces angustmyceticus TaxID=285578 RepID=UPI0036D042F5